MMKDRHLDQILMCAVYIMCRVSKNDKTFTEIMRCYRSQPQAASHVYRSVLMVKIDETNNTASSEETNQQVIRCNNPTEIPGTATVHDQKVRGDLILFYNTVYIRTMQNFTMKFANPQEVRNLHLSPLPATKHLMPSPPKRRVTDNVYVRPYDHLASPNQVKEYTYSFSRSPSKVRGTITFIIPLLLLSFFQDLKNINMMVSSRGGKRLLGEDVEDDDIIPIKKRPPAVTRKLQGMFEDRLVQAKE